MNTLRLIIAFAASLAAGPALADAGNFLLVNAAGEPLSAISVRPVSGGAWQTLGSGSATAGSRQPISFSSDQCAFDLRASLPGGRQVTWSGVNLCDTKIVTLNRRSDGTNWVEYD